MTLEGDDILVIEPTMAEPEQQQKKKEEPEQPKKKAEPEQQQKKKDDEKIAAGGPDIRFEGDKAIVRTNGPQIDGMEDVAAKALKDVRAHACL